MKKISTLAITVALTAMGLGPFSTKVQATSYDYYCAITGGGGHFNAGDHYSAIEYCQMWTNATAISQCSGQPDGDPFILEYVTLYFPYGYMYQGEIVHWSYQTYRCQDGWAVIV